MQLCEIKLQGFFLCEWLMSPTLTSELDKIKQMQCYMNILKFVQHSINTDTKKKSIFFPRVAML